MHSVNSLNDEDREAFAIVESALRSQYLIKAPVGFSSGVMERLQSLPSQNLSVSLPKFQLSWLDLVVSFSFSGMVGVVMFVWGNLPPIYLARLRVELLLLWQKLNLALQTQIFWLLMMIVMCLLAGCVFLVLVVSLFRFDEAN